MKKYLLPLLVIPFLLLSCSSNEPEGGSGDVSQVLGKSFKNYSIDEEGEYSLVYEFPHSRVCVSRNYGELWYEGSYSKTEYYEYSVSGNKINLKDPATDEVMCTLIYSSGSLTDADTKMVYKENGSVELDNSLDKLLPPAGKRTYIPAGWYSHNYFENWVESMAKPMANSGDTQGLRNLPQSIRDDVTMGSAIRIVDNIKLETVYSAITTRNHDSYMTKTYGSVLYYYYFEFALNSYYYKVIDGTIYVQNHDGKWLYMGEYSSGSNKLEFYSLNDEVPSGTYTKVNYSGSYD